MRRQDASAANTDVQRDHIGIFGVEVIKIGFVRVGVSVATGLPWDNNAVIVLQAVYCGGPNAAAGRQSRDNHRIDASVRQPLI